MMRWTRILSGVVVVGLVSVGLAQDAATQPATGPAQVRGAQRPPEIVADQLTPKGTMKLYYIATRSGDGEALRELMRAQTPQEKEFVDARVALMQAERALGAAASARFGNGMDRYLRLPATMPADAAGLNVDYILAALQEEVNGDRATVGNGQQSVKLVRVEGKWLISLETERLDKAEEFRRQAKVYRGIAADVAAGKYVSPPQITTAMRAQLGPASQPATAAP